MKKLVCVILIFLLLLTMSSCSFFDRFNSDLGDISFDEDRNLVYHGNTYYKTDLGFYVDYAEGDDLFRSRLIIQCVEQIIQYDIVSGESCQPVTQNSL